MNGNIEKLKDIIFILIVTGVFTVVANMVGYKGTLVGGSIGVIVLILITLVGVLISMIPGLSKLPVVFWVSVVGVVVSVPGFPGQEWILAQAKQVSFLSLTTPILAYGGLCLGKDLPAFQRLSWRIVPVALAVAAGSFICAAVLAEIVLHFEGVF